MFPLIATSRPSPSLVTVGYHRAKCMFGPAVHVFATGSNTEVTFRPIVPLKPWPPTMTARPSARVVCPEQKMSRPNGLTTDVRAALAGSNTYAGFGATHPSITSNVSVGIRMLCAATIGQLMSGDQPPSWSGGGGGGGGVGGVPAYTDAGPLDQRGPVDQVEGSDVRVVCALFSASDPPGQHWSRNIKVPPVPRMAIQYVVPPVTAVEGIGTAFQAPTAGFAMLPCASKVPGCPLTFEYNPATSPGAEEFEST